MRSRQFLGMDFGSKAEGRFVILFVLWCTVGFLGVAAISAGGGWPFLQEAYARITAQTLSAIGIPAELQGYKVLIPGSELAGMSIVLGCTGLSEQVLFSSGVLALPVDRRERALGLLLGILGVVVLTWGRLFVLGILFKTHPDWYLQAHRLFQQGFLILTVVPLWVIWAIWASRSQARRSSARTDGAVS